MTLSIRVFSLTAEKKEISPLILAGGKESGMSQPAYQNSQKCAEFWWYYVAHGVTIYDWEDRTLTPPPPSLFLLNFTVFTVHVSCNYATEHIL